MVGSIVYELKSMKSEMLLLNQKSNLKTFAVDIEWDTDGEDADIIGLPSWVEIPENVDEE